MGVLEGDAVRERLQELPALALVQIGPEMCLPASLFCGGPGAIEAIDRVGLQIVHAIAKAFIGVHDSAIPPQAPISEINDVAIQA